MLCLLLFTKINIFVFASAIWTAFFAVPYLALSPVSSFDFERRWGIPGMESSVMILWLAGFVFQACSLPSPVHCTSADCTVSQVAVVFGAFEWYVFSIISKALYYCTQYINFYIGLSSSSRPLELSSLLYGSLTSSSTVVFN